jgi:hypothetical protein
MKAYTGRFAISTAICKKNKRNLDMPQPKQPTHPEIFTLTDMANFLGISPRKVVDDYVHSEKLRHLAIPYNGGYKYFFPKDWLMDDLISIGLELGK